LQGHRCDDSDVRRQLTEEKLNCNALKTRLQKAQDNFDRQLEKQNAVEAAHSKGIEKLNTALKENEERKQKMAELELEFKRLELWADQMDNKYPALLTAYEEKEEKNKELTRKLEQSSSACSKLKAEVEKLQGHRCDDSDVRRQLTEEKLNSNALKTRLQKAQDDFDRRLEKQNAENDRLEEKVRELQNTIRQLQDAANNTYTALHHPRPKAAAAAADAEQYPALPVSESGGVVEKVCLSHNSAKVRELQKKLELVEEKKEKYKAYIVKLKGERDELRALQNRANCITMSPEAASLRQKECANADENVEECGACTGRVNTNTDIATQMHTTSDAAEIVDKISDCKHQ